MDISNSTVPTSSVGNGFYLPPAIPMAPASGDDQGIITWERLVALCPALGELERFAARAGSSERNWLHVRARLGCIVGWSSPAWAHPVLAETQSFDVAYRHLRAVWERAHADCPRRRRRAG